MRLHIIAGDAVFVKGWRNSVYMTIFDIIHNQEMLFIKPESYQLESAVFKF